MQATLRRHSDRPRPRARSRFHGLFASRRCFGFFSFSRSLVFRARLGSIRSPAQLFWGWAPVGISGAGRRTRWTHEVVQGTAPARRSTAQATAFSNVLGAVAEFACADSPSALVSRFCAGDFA